MINKIKFNLFQEVVMPQGQKVRLPLPPNVALQLQAPSVPVNITHPLKIIQQQQKEGKAAQVFNCKALIDTGSATCVITQKVVDQLGLIQTGFKKIIGIHGGEDRPVYFGRLMFSWGKSAEVSLVCCELTGFDCLLGRDILRNWHFTYDGVNGEITICD